MPEAFIKPLESALDALCEQHGFPRGEEFKWSPGRELWMHDNLVDEAREAFLTAAITTARQHGAQFVVVIEEAGHATATHADTAEEDVVRLLLERADNHVRGLGCNAIVITDRPGGNRAAEDRFMAGCIDTLREGTRFVQFGNLSLVITTASKLVRIVQLADVVTGCTTAFVGGQRQYAEAIFETIRPAFRTELGRIGGVGLKLHPDYKFANLYHWLLGDNYIVRYPIGHPLPAPGLPYSTSPDEP